MTRPCATYKVFGHRFIAQASVVQQDGPPLGALRPTPPSRRAKPSPTYLASPGIYQLRIGLSEVNTQARLPTTQGAEFWEGSQGVVK